VYWHLLYLDLYGVLDYQNFHVPLKTHSSVNIPNNKLIKDVVSLQSQHFITRRILSVNAPYLWQLLISLVARTVPTASLCSSLPPRSDSCCSCRRLLSPASRLISHSRNLCLNAAHISQGQRPLSSTSCMVFSNLVVCFFICAADAFGIVCLGGTYLFK
jgi:hypothetical protein